MNGRVFWGVKEKRKEKREGRHGRAALAPLAERKRVESPVKREKRAESEGGGRSGEFVAEFFGEVVVAHAVEVGDAVAEEEVGPGAVEAVEGFVKGTPGFGRVGLDDAGVFHAEKGGVGFHSGSLPVNRRVFRAAVVLKQICRFGVSMRRRPMVCSLVAKPSK